MEGEIIYVCQHTSFTERKDSKIRGQDHDVLAMEIFAYDPNNENNRARFLEGIEDSENKVKSRIMKKRIIGKGPIKSIANPKLPKATNKKNI
jgi:hypothetical protein